MNDADNVMELLAHVQTVDARRPSLTFLSSTLESATAAAHSVHVTVDLHCSAIVTPHPVVPR